MRIVLVIGTALTVSFTSCFGSEDGRLQATLVGLVATAVALLLFLVYFLANPYRGEVRVQPEGLELVLEQSAARTRP